MNAKNKEKPWSKTNSHPAKMNKYLANRTLYQSKKVIGRKQLDLIAEATMAENRGKPADHNVVKAEKIKRAADIAVTECWGIIS